MRSIWSNKIQLRGNLRVLAVRRIFFAISGGLTGGLSALYVKDVLGADAVILGLFSSIWSAVYLVFILIGGWIGDRYNRRNILLLGTALTMPNPIIYALAPSWHLLIFANLLGALGSALVNPAYTGILYSSVGQRERTRVIATLNTLSSFVNLIVPPLGAYLIESTGGLQEIRKMFILEFIISLAIWIYTSRTLRIERAAMETEVESLPEALKDILVQMKAVYRLSRERKASSWLYMQLVGPFAWELVGPFWTIYAADVCRSPLFVIGLLSSVDSVARILLEVPLANISDKKGRKKTMLILRPFRYMCIVALLIGGSYGFFFVPFVPLLAWALDAIGTSTGPSWSAAQTEVMPDEVQARWNALLSFVWRVTAIPASLLGGFLWNIDPRFPFVFALAVDAFFRLPVLIQFIPETLVPPRRKVPKIGPHVVIYGLTEAGVTSTARLVQRTMKTEIIDASLVGSRKIGRILRSEEHPVIVEGAPALYAAEDAEESVRVLLVASREERTRRRAAKSKKPEFVALREVEEEDREVDRIARRLYRTDLSKMPPFDVAINTERIPPDKVARIIAVLREENGEEESKSES